jgi:ADP-ribosylglycohydrolase
MPGGLDRLTERAAACLIYGRVGDAMGTQTENLEPDEIERRFGWVDSFEGDGTDDSIMADLLADALLRTDGYANADDWARSCHEQRSRIFGDKESKFFSSVTHSLRKIRIGYLPRLVALGNMASSSSAMAIAPVGIVNAGHPRAAAAQAAEIASFFHIHDVGFCQDAAAAIAAAIAAALAPDATLDGVLAASRAYLKPWSGGEMLALIDKAIGLARDNDYNSFRAIYHQEFRCPIACDSRETIPATLALCLLADGDPARAVELGANFGRDADTIACMAGYICGALRGTAPAGGLAIPETISAPATKLAAALVTTGRKKAAAELAGWSRTFGAPG